MTNIPITATTQVFISRSLKTGITNLRTPQGVNLSFEQRANVMLHYASTLVEEIYRHGYDVYLLNNKDKQEHKLFLPLVCSEHLVKANRGEMVNLVIPNTLLRLLPKVQQNDPDLQSITFSHNWVGYSALRWMLSIATIVADNGAVRCHKPQGKTKIGEMYEYRYGSFWDGAKLLGRSSR